MYRSLPTIYIHLLSLLCSFNGKEKKVSCSLLAGIIIQVLTVRTQEIAFQVSSGKILFWLGGGVGNKQLNKQIHTDLFFLLEDRGKTTRKVLCSGSYILLYLDKVLLVATSSLGMLFFPCLYFAPCTTFPNYFKTCVTSKNCLS